MLSWPPRPALLRGCALWFFALCAGIVAILSFAYTLLAWPVADDICRAAVGRSWSEAADYVALMHRSLTGRWLSIGFYALALPRLGIETVGYTLSLLLLQLVWLLAFCLAGRLVLGRAREAAFASLGLLLLFWTGMKSPAESWYWFTGAFEYGVPLLVAMSCCTLAARIDPLRAVAAALLGAAVAALNELPAVILFGALCCWALGLLVAGRRRDGTLCALVALVTLLSTIATLAAPGNMVRAGYDATGGGDPLNLVKAFARPEQTPFAWLADPRLIAATVVALASTRIRALAPAWTGRPWAPLVPLAIFLLILAGYGSVWVAKGAMPPARAMNLLYALFLMGWLAGAAIAAARLGPIVPTDRHLCAQAAGLAVLAVGLLASANTSSAVRDLRYTATEWRAHMRDRFDRSSEMIVITARRRPEMVKWEDIRPDPEQWLHACYRQYLGTTVRVVGE